MLLHSEPRMQCNAQTKTCHHGVQALREILAASSAETDAQAADVLVLLAHISPPHLHMVSQNCC